jgi:hypothetical protein
MIRWLILFAEEPGVVVQVLSDAYPAATLAEKYQLVCLLASYWTCGNGDDHLHLDGKGKTACCKCPRREALALWWETSYRIQAMRDNPELR